MKHIVNNEEQTKKLVNNFSKVIDLPLIIGFKGDLGVGKTFFVRNLVRTYKSGERVKSPTFSLIEEYCFRDVNIYHIDLYRIKENESEYLDIRSYYSNNSLILIEWIENDQNIMRKTDIIININILNQENSREFNFTGNTKSGKNILKKLNYAAN